MSLRWWLLLALLWAGPALACQLVSGTPEPTAAVPPTLPAPAATETPLPTATPVPTEISFADYDSEALGLRFQYPAGWVLEERDGFPVVATEPEVLEDGAIREGAAAVFFVVGEAAEVAEGPLDSALQAVLEELFAVDTITSAPTLAEINRQEAAVATVARSETAEEIIVYVTLIRAGERAVLVSATVPAEDTDLYRNLLDGIANSVVLRPPPGPIVSGSLGYGDTVEGEVTGTRGNAWSFIGVAGETVDIEVSPAEDELDVTVDVHDSEGISILTDGPIDNAFGTEVIRGLTLPDSDEYRIVLRGFAGSTGAYTLTLAESGSGMVTGETILLELGNSYQGTLAENEADTYLLTNLIGITVTLIVEPDSDLDVLLEVYGPGGGLVAEADAGFSGTAETVTITPLGGNVQVRGWQGDAGDYTLIVREAAAADISTGEIEITAADTLEEEDTEGHTFPFTAPAGAIVSARVVPERELDVVVEVWNEDNLRLETVDLSFGTEEVTFTVPEDGNYSFVVLGFDGQAGDYVITITGPADAIFELAAGDQVNGTFGENAAIIFAIGLNPGETIVITATADADTDAVLELSDLDDNLLESADEYFAGGAETVTFTAPGDIEEGTLFFITLREYRGAAGGTFTLEIEDGQ